MPRKAIVVAATASLLINGCAVITKDDFPPASLQPTLGPLPSVVGYAVETQDRWLESTSPYSQETQESKNHSLLRLRGIGKASASNLDKSTIIAINNVLSGYFQTTESRTYRTNNTQPSLCIALSGGGIRAAAFGIGVLQGLNESGKLGSVDVVSAVSGGAYALAWYVQNRIDGVSDDELLSDEHIQKAINPSLFSLPVAGLGFVASPLNFLVAGSGFSNGIDSSTLNDSYHGMLSGSFGIPLFHNLGMDRLRGAVENGQIPLPIVGISAYPLPVRLDGLGKPDEALTTYAKSVALNDTYMEVTPYRLGIQGFGFHRGPLAPIGNDLWRYVEISGAAYDRPHDPKSLGRLSGQIRLGGMMSLVVKRHYPSTDSLASSDQLYRQLFYATDGGFSENLAAFPLVLRRCETIVIADSEHDPEWIMEGYRVLKNRLALEHGLELSVHGIDGILSHRTSGVEFFKRADGLELPRTDNECARASDAPPCAARDAEETVFYGSLSMIPLSMKDVDAERKIRIIYLKLGLQRNAPESDPPNSVKSLMEKCMQTPEKCYFPQDQTFDKTDRIKSQQYTWNQFRAYKDLARDMIKKVVW